MEGVVLALSLAGLSTIPVSTAEVIRDEGTFIEKMTTIMFLIVLALLFLINAYISVMNM